MILQGKKYSGVQFIKLNRFTIKNRLLIGFGTVCLILVIAVGVTIAQLGNIDKNITRINNLRMPTASASSSLVKEIYASLASLRGYMLTGNNKFKNQRARVWTNIDRLKNDMDSLSRNWTNSHDVKAWANFKVILKEFRTAQQNAENMAGSPEQYPAMVIPTNKAIPRAGELLNILVGANGKGGMVADQKNLLEKDVAYNLSRSHSLILLLWAISSVGLLLSVGVALLSAGSITKPIRSMTDVMTKLAEGDTTVNVPCLDRADEIGTMASSVEAFKENALERIRLEQETLEAEQARIGREEARRETATALEREEIKRERATVAEREARATKVNDLIATFENKVRKMMNVMATSSTMMGATAKQLVATSSDTKERSSVVATASDETATNVNMVASAAEELSSSVQEISRQVTNAADISKGAVEEAKQSETAISALAAAAKKINDVIGIISDIAEQTNLLALNATIESARAGEAGKGFAVVASEVKALAGQTSNATNEISLQIKEMQNLTETAVTSIKNIVDVNNRSNETTTSIQAAVEQQSSATNEIAHNIQQVAEGTNEVSVNITRVAAGADQTGEAGEQVLNVAGEIRQISESLKKGIEQFLSDVRAA